MAAKSIESPGCGRGVRLVLSTWKHTEAKFQQQDGLKTEREDGLPLEGVLAP